jgi:proteasome lid subunit RPN8/RPN11
VISWKESQGDARPSTFVELRNSLSIVDAITLFRAPAAPARVILADAVRESILSYLRTSGAELGGLLLGRVFQNRQRNGAEQVILICDAVTAEKFDSTGVSLRMDTHVWDKARPRLRDGMAIVGWVHSHPNLGAFFSGTDRATQRAFFNQPYSLGWVVDPIRQEEAWFVGAASTALDPRHVFRQTAHKVEVSP